MLGRRSGGENALAGLCLLLRRFPIVAPCQRRFINQGFCCGDLALLGVETKQVPFFVLVPFLPNVPAVVFILGKGKQGARGRLIAIPVAFGSADFVKYAALIEENAPTLYGPQHGQPVPAPLAQLTLVFNE